MFHWKTLRHFVWNPPYGWDSSALLLESGQSLSEDYFENACDSGTTVNSHLFLKGIYCDNNISKMELFWPGALTPSVGELLVWLLSPLFWLCVTLHSKPARLLFRTRLGLAVNAAEFQSFALQYRESILRSGGSPGRRHSGRSCPFLLAQHCLQPQAAFLRAVTPQAFLNQRARYLSFFTLQD